MTTNIFIEKKIYFVIEIGKINLANYFQSQYQIIFLLIIQKIN